MTVMIGTVSPVSGCGGTVTGAVVGGVAVSPVPSGASWVDSDDGSDGGGAASEGTVDSDDGSDGGGAASEGTVDSVGGGGSEASDDGGSDPAV